MFPKIKKNAEKFLGCERGAIKKASVIKLGLLGALLGGLAHETSADCQILFEYNWDDGVCTHGEWEGHHNSAGVKDVKFELLSQFEVLQADFGDKGYPCADRKNDDDSPGGHGSAHGSCGPVSLDSWDHINNLTLTPGADNTEIVAQHEHEIGTVAGTAHASSKCINGGKHHNSHGSSSDCSSV